MTLLLVHNRYQQPGGEDQVFESERDMLRQAGHEVVTYEVHNDAVQGMGRLSLFLRTLWNPRTVRDIRTLIRQHRPAVVHCHNTFPLVSPSVYWACRKAGVPVVQTLHNFRLTCLNAYLFRDGKVCERCFGRFPWAGLRHRCYRDSLAASGVAALCWFLHFRVLRTYHRAVDRYIVLTEFGRAKMLALGLPPEKLVVKPNVISLSPIPPPHSPPSHTPPPVSPSVPSVPSVVKANTPPSTSHFPLSTSHFPLSTSHFPTVLYVGRLSSEKGVDILIRAWHLAADRLPSGAQLLIVGDGPEREALERLAGEDLTRRRGDAEEIQAPDITEPTEQDGNHNPPIGNHKSKIENHKSPHPPTSALPYLSFLGRQPKSRVLELMRAARLFVLPSICYETFGMALCEAAMCGCPSVVSGHGAVASMVLDGQTGFHVPPGDPAALAEVLVRALADPDGLAAMGRAAAEAIRSGDSDPDRNLVRLLAIYAALNVSSDHPA